MPDTSEGTLQSSGVGGPASGRGVRFALWTAAAIALILLAVVLVRFSGFIDVAVYEWAGAAVLDGRPLYVPDGTTLPFVYPPFAALLFVPLALWPAGAAGLLSLISLTALARISWLLSGPLLTRLGDAGAGVTRGVRRSSVAAGLFALTAVLEPSVETLRLGQVSLLLLWFVVEDLCRHDSPTRGVLTGLAAAIKVVPGFFLLFYAVVGRLRVAVTGVAAFGLATALAWAILPSDSIQYWFHDLLSTRRVGAPIEFVGNQSLAAAWARTTGVDPSGTVVWLSIMALVAIAGLWICRRLWLSGEQLVAFGFAGLVSLLVSPVSWTHHWVFLYPLLIGLLAGCRPRWVVVIVAIDWVVLLSRIVWRVPNGSDGGLDGSLMWWPVANAYVIVGLVTAGVVITTMASQAGAARKGSRRADNEVAR